ncbi:hypothetical protein FJP69_04045 [Stenotrophomonas maltophilia]|nr:hypothetical protein FJP69_04045 [Stenotrophomonas maltophilia]
MDAAAKPTRTYLRRPRHPTPPRQPTDSPLLLLLLPLIRQVQGAALPANLTPARAPSVRPAHAASRNVPSHPARPAPAPPADHG